MLTPGGKPTEKREVKEIRSEEEIEDFQEQRLNCDK
jgi:hypothetical protein